MAKKSKSNYSVDVFDQGFPEEWRHFKTLRKAVRFAKRHGLPGERIVDYNGNAVPGLDLEAPQWMTHPDLEEALRRETERADRKAAEVAKEQDAHRNWQIRMIQVGLVPLELITSRLTQAEVDARPHTTGWPSPQFVSGDIKVTLTLNGNPDPEASETGRRPFSVLLKALQDGMK
jgi:hypothetical protein